MWPLWLRILCSRCSRTFCRHFIQRCNTENLTPKAWHFHALLSGTKLHIALTHAVFWWAIAQLHAGFRCERARFQDWLHNREEPVGVRAIHIEGAVLTADRDFIAVVLTDASRNDRFFEFPLQRENRLQVG